MGNIHPYRADSAVFTAGTRRPFQAWFGVGLGRKTMGKIALAALLLIAPMTGQAGPPPPRQGVEIVRHWLDLARDHTPGQLDEAVRDVRAFSINRLTALRRVTSSNDEDGFAHAVEQFILRGRS